MVEPGLTFDEVYRSRQLLAVKDYDVVYYRPLEGGPWQSTHVLNLRLAANAEYLYYFSAETGWLSRLGDAGGPEVLDLPDIPQWPVHEKPLLFAHDSVLIIVTHALADPYQLDRLYLSTDFGNTFLTIDLSPAGAEEIRSACFIDGRLYVLQALGGIKAYDPVVDSWSPYNTGLPETPGQLVAFQGRLVATCPHSGLFYRAVEPAYRATGNVFLDQNGNGLWDAGETAVKRVGIRADLAGGINFSSDDGRYSSATDVPVDTHRVLLPHPLMVSKPAAAITDQADVLQDFALQIPGNPHDLSVGMTATNRFRPGFETPLYLNVGNLLLPSTGVRLSLVFPPQFLHLQVAAPSPAFVSPAGDSIVWNLDTLGVFAGALVALVFQTDVNAPLGAVISLRAMVQGAEPDANPLDNQAVFDNVVVGSYDPNDKLASRSAISIQTPPVAEWLAYTIRFQNTGTFAADYVTLIDTLDAQQFDVSSWRFLGSSHPFEARIVDERILKVRFDHLNLLPQQQSDPESQGYFSFAIRTRHPLDVPTVLKNRAGIYFDFNPVVLTPFATTQVDYLVPTHPAPAAALRIYPNPAAASIRIERPGGPFRVAVFDARGRLWLEKRLSQNESHLVLDAAPAGLLFLRMEGEDGVYWGKVVKQ